jgi:hypothetical protein
MRPHLFGIVLLVLTAASLSGPASGRAEAINTQNFVERYRTEVAALTEPYEQVHLVARITDFVPKTGAQTVYEMTLDRNHDLYKVTRNDQSGARAGAASIAVANPDLSFSLDRAPDQTQYAVKYLSTRRGLRYDELKQIVLGRSLLLRAPYSYFEIPLTEFFAMPALTIQRVQEERSAGKSLFRVWVRFDPFSDQFRKAEVDYSEGWFLFEPAAHWALHGMEVKHWKKDKSLLHCVRSSVAYQQPVRDIPLVRRAHLGLFNASDKPVLEYSADFEAVQFGPVPAEEFTLDGCGVSGVEVGGRRGVRAALYWSAGASVLAVATIVVLRRRRAAVPVAGSGV